MKLHLFEACTANMGRAGGNYGKFAVGVPGPEEWAWRTQLPDPDEASPFGTRPVLAQQGWGPRHVWVMDLATGEGAIFGHGGYARADLNARRIWVCVLFEAFLQWLYRQDLTKIDELPKLVELEAPFELHGYRRAGFWYHRAENMLRLLPGPGVCTGLCLHKQAATSRTFDNT